jgi:hypothetical protein
MKTKVVEQYDQVRVWQVRNLYPTVMNVTGMIFKKGAPYRSVKKAQEQAEEKLAATQWTLATYAAQVRKYMGEKMADRLERRFNLK